MRGTLLAVLGLLVSMSANAHEGELNCFPENDQLRPIVNGFAPNGMDEAMFNQVLDRVDEVYKPIFSAKGWTLKTKRLWENNTVNASAHPGMIFKSNKIINMYGGLARHETITPDGFALVACHEVGHHYGGAPKIGGSNSWASNEGQADYFATVKCLRRIFANDDNIAIVNNMEIPETVKETCISQFETEGEQAICMRSTMAGYSVANLFRALRKQETHPSVDTPDPTVVSRIYDRHPATQCRLDTYYAGAVCDMDLDIGLSDRDPNKGVCSRKFGQTIGVRPLCWFKPRTNLSVAGF